MAPSKASRGTDDARADAAASHPRDPKPTVHQTSAKMRRGASQASASQLREAAAAAAATTTSSQACAEATGSTLDWSSFDREILHAYRRIHRLTTPPSSASTYHSWVLSQPRGIGLYSPTMVYKNKAPRQNKHQLATVVRKHFNGMGVQENDAIVDLLYKLRNSQRHGPSGMERHGQHRAFGTSK